MPNSLQYRRIGYVFGKREARQVFFSTSAKRDSERALPEPLARRTVRLIGYFRARDVICGIDSKSVDGPNMAKHDSHGS